MVEIRNSHLLQRKVRGNKCNQPSLGIEGYSPFDHLQLRLIIVLAVDLGYLA